MKALKAIIVAGAMFACAPLAEAKTMALLVGVADYNEASGITDLHGPRNDVSLLWRALKSRDVKPEDITVLTNPLPEGADYPVAKGLAEGANILAELDRIAALAQRGDTVIFYYSGHGTRQPADPNRQDDEPEADGMDQVLLPSDVASYDPIKMTLRNAIVDNTLGDKITAIRAKGAFVWAVVDACHSGTVTRGEDVTRSVDPAKLGVPENAPASSTRGGDRRGTLRASHVQGEGGLVGFYAVESYDLAIERAFPGYNLPMVGDGKTQRMGVFTYLLHRALTRNTASTYRDLAQEIVADLNGDRTGGKVPPPVFDGDLDADVPGSNAARLPNSVTGILADGKIGFPAGTLHGFDVGARLALYAPGKPEKPIGHADISEATAVTSTASAIDWEQGAGQPPTISALVEEPAINFRFVVSPPPDADFLNEAMKTRVAASVGSAFKGEDANLGVELGNPGDPDADVMLRVKSNRLWIVRSDRPWVTVAGAYDETPSLALADDPEKFGSGLKNAVWSLARAAKLLRVTAALESGAESDDGLTVTATISKVPGQDARGACAGSEVPAGAQSSPLEPLLPMAAGNCTFVLIQVQNDGEIDYYVSGFYVDSLGGIAAIPASAAKRGCVRTLPAGSQKTLDFRFWIDTWDENSNKPSSTGAENFVVLAVPKGDDREPPKLCALTQSTLASMQRIRNMDFGGTRGSDNKLATLIGNLEGTSTRGVTAAPEGDGPKMTGRLFVFDVKP
ncbi:MAG: caspase family protein [Rhizobiales bacterium]|nr:caspase family protein [Hyphomicrobiales bacterium]